MSSEDENKSIPESPINSSASEIAPKAVKKRAAKKKSVKKRARLAPKGDVEQPDMFSTQEIEPRSVPAKKAVKRAAKKARKVAGADETTSAGVEAREHKGNSSIESEVPAPKGNSVVSFSPDDDPSDEKKGGDSSSDKSPKKHSDSPRGRSDRRGHSDGNSNPRHNSSKGGGHHSGGPKSQDRSQNFNRDRQGRNNKFKNKPKKGKGRWQNKGKQAREEISSIEMDGLLEYELLQNYDEVLKLSDSLGHGAVNSLDFYQVYDSELPQLRAAVEAAGLKTPHAPNRDQLINAMVSSAAEAKSPILTTGVLEVLDDDEGGILVYQRDSYRVRALSAYVPKVFIERFGLQRGHIVKAQLHPHREGESCPFVVRVLEVMDRDPETLTEIVPFTERVPYYPLDRILMEAEGESKWDNLSMRVVDCLTPVGFGQRGLIVAPPRTGKTVLMQGIANSIQRNYPDSHLIILLIDERPEEVTDFRRQVSGEVISSTFDESAESHVHAAEMVIEKARRMVEVGKDVVILLDSITRLARAYNTTMPSSGKILSGGVEANALQKPKRFFGSARNIEDGGSLTIIATALVETGSKMDEVIFEEFKGTGNMELHLDRGLSDKRIFPALSMDKSGTRKEELLYHPDEMLKIYSLRRAMKGLPSTDAMEMLIQRIKKTKTNAEFLMSVAR